MKMAKPWCRILAREGVRFQCHYCKAVWEFRGSEFLLWFIMLRAGGSLCTVSDKEMGAFSTLQIKKKEKKTKQLQNFLDMVTVLWFTKQVPWQPIVKQWNGLPGRAGESLFVCYTWPGLPLGLAPPNTVGGTCERICFFSTGRALANLEHRTPICSCCTYPERQPDLNKIVMGGSQQERERAMLDGKTEASGTESQRWIFFCILK